MWMWIGRPPVEVERLEVRGVCAADFRGAGAGSTSIDVEGEGSWSEVESVGEGGLSVDSGGGCGASEVAIDCGP